MSEDYGLQLSLSLPPVAQYAKGDMLNIRGDNPTEFKENLAFARELAAGDALIARFFEAAEEAAKAKVEAAFAPAPAPRPVAEDPAPSRVMSGITDKQKGLIFGIAKRRDISDERLMSMASKVAGGKVGVITDLTKKEASSLIDLLQTA